jgi:ADP-ribose pyrophosphatase YjhB (NUDIX family)
MIVDSPGIRSGQWAFPGGHLEYGESFFACAEREALEETGIVVKAEKVAAVTNDVFDAENKHYITIFVLCRRVDAREPQVCHRLCLGDA